MKEVLNAFNKFCEEDLLYIYHTKAMIATGRIVALDSGYLGDGETMITVTVANEGKIQEIWSGISEAILHLEDHPVWKRKRTNETTEKLTKKKVVNGFEFTRKQKYYDKGTYSEHYSTPTTFLFSNEWETVLKFVKLAKASAQEFDKDYKEYKSSQDQ